MSSVKAIYPGTFDPITNGHIDIIKRSVKIFNTLIVAVAEDTNKSTLFDLNERLELTKQEVGTLNANIEVKAFKGLLVDFANKEGCTLIIRGLRAVSDFEYEFKLAYMNYKLCPQVETFFIPASENGHFISSRFVKELSRLNGNLNAFVSDNVARRMQEKVKHD